MTAPIDAYLTPSQAERAIRPRNQEGVRKVRYLRADLMCGECGLHDTDHYCPAHGYLWRAGDAPACMAFVPKGVQP